ncbi:MULTISPECIES: methyltransferase domain-containing protein [Vagococcus]|uniref:Methyltransferase domain-containing protein n=1 Tax=Vagococcus fluvialis bH819 TaxID=1255619 RepID=A0A1X6WQ02_9ENTE|nr:MULTISPECIES: methyltransferase domain-containing protein [Vagococcus]SLM86384.1 hypothetical protein FM121_09855 [Vagococcus fluvialis bH819]HCM89038.1 methyltransferase domain-containing protein [Vagococcus sp.]
MHKYFCDTCHFIYDEELGDVKNGVPPKTPIKELSGSLCNRCQMKNLNRYSIIFSDYKNLEAKYYGMFSGKWHIDYFLDYLNPLQMEKMKILEVGTGLGKVANALINRGINVTGVEMSSEFVDQLEHQQWTKSPLFNLIAGNIFSMPIKEKFDVIVVADSTFQELVYQKNEAAVLALFAQLVEPSGVIWLETMTVNQSFQVSRKKNIDLKRAIHLESQINASKNSFTYQQIFELFCEGVSKERNTVSRSLPTILKENLEAILPDSLEFVDNFDFPKPGKIKPSDQTLNYWTDGGYPLATSNELVKKEIIILKNRGVL